MSDYVSLSFGEFNYGSFRKFHYSLLSMIIAQNRESYGIISPSEITLDVYLRGVDDMRQPSCALSSRQLNYREFPLIFLNKAGSMCTWKLQKLCYYSQAWSIAWTETPLFEEDFVAWKNGPVCRELFFALKGRFTVSEDDLPNGDFSILNSDQKETIDIVVCDYGNSKPFELRELSHTEAPWLDARKGLNDDEDCNNVISKSSMGEYYGSL